jgi:hypothetical protein
MTIRAKIYSDAIDAAMADEAAATVLEIYGHLAAGRKEEA